jgi:chemotaxis protein MotB
MGLARKGGGHGGGGGGGHDGSGGLRWLLTYADMITLLLALFVFLFSISSVSEPKLEAFSVSFAQMFGIGTLPTGLANPSGGDSVLPIPGMRRPSDQPADEPRKQSRIRSLAPMLRREQYREMEQELTKVLPDLVKEGRLTFEENREGLVLRLRDSALFGLGSAGMDEGAQEVLDTIADSLSRIGNPIRIEGHTDNVPLRAGRYTSNWELSGARAAAVVENFIDSGGLDPNRLSLAGYGEYRPVAENVPGTGNPQNRRVEILILNAPRPVSLPEPLPIEGEAVDLLNIPGTTPVPDTGVTPPAETAPTPEPAPLAPVAPVVIEPAPAAEPTPN